MSCYNALLEKSGLDQYTAEKMVFCAKQEYHQLDQGKIFQEQSDTIKTINNTLGSDTYNNFVPNYKSYATLSQIFGTKTPLKSRVLLEKKVIDNLTSAQEGADTLENLDSLVVKKFSHRFNSGYDDLLPEQKKMLGQYMLSFKDRGADFRLFLSEELKRIYAKVKDSLSTSELLEDKEMHANTHKVLEEMEDINVSTATQKDILKVLKLQQLVREYETDAS